MLNIKIFVVILGVIKINKYVFGSDSNGNERPIEYFIQVEDSWLDVIKLNSERFGFNYVQKVVSNVHLFANYAEDSENLEEKSLKAVEDFKDFFGSKIISIEQRRFSLVKYRPWQNDTSVTPKRDFGRWILENYAEGQPKNCWPYYEMGVEDVWGQGITGKGVSVAVVDNGVNSEHPDLKKNLDTNLSRSFVDKDPSDFRPPRFTSYIAETDETTSHGTMVAGLIAGEINNQYCSAGVAFESNLVALKVFSKDENIRMIEWLVTGFPYSGEKLSLALRYERDKIDIYSCSFNRDEAFVKLPLDTRVVLKEGVETGRNGKGNLFILSAGNRGGSVYDCNMEGFASSEHTIVINSVGERGSVPSFGLPCAAALASTFGECKTLAGLRKLETTAHEHQCMNGKGTSASAALASGNYALLLQANPNLTWRCVQHITVLTSSLEGLQTAGDRHRNGAGFEFNHRFGFGLHNVSAMVELAKNKNWTTVPRMFRSNAYETSPSDRTVRQTAIEITLKYNSCKLDEKCVNYLEQVLVYVIYNTSIEDRLIIDVMSPAGTLSRIFHRGVHKVKGVVYRHWRLKTVHFWGENPHGSWTIRFSGSRKLNSSKFKLLSASVEFLGTSIHPNTQAVHETTGHVSDNNLDTTPRDAVITESSDNLHVAPEHREWWAIVLAIFTTVTVICVLLYYPCVLMYHSAIKLYNVMKIRLFQAEWVHPEQLYTEIKDDSDQNGNTDDEVENVT